MARNQTVGRRLEALAREEGAIPSLAVANIAKPRVTLGELAYERLREAILTTRLKPGTPISENELASAIGISRTPIREAIRRLAEERLVELTSQFGTTVSRIDAGRARQAVFVRQNIECEVLRQVGRLTEGRLAALEQQVRAHKQVIGAGDAVAAARMDDEFHADLMEACVCPEATRAVRAVSGDIARILFLSGANEDYFGSVAHDHERLIRMMRADDYAGAIDLLRKHIGGFALDQDVLRTQSANFFTGDDISGTF
jgi:DNA-binding GntR family transcriptional regulator